MENKCLHPLDKRKSISSEAGCTDTNLITVQCMKCGYLRYEARNSKTGGITYSKWFKKR